MLKTLIHWLLAYVVIVALHVIAWLPRQFATSLAVLLGRMFEYSMRRRRAIVEANLKACFPDWSDQQRRQLRRELFQSLGLSVYEIALAWCRLDSRKLPSCEIQGLQHIENAIQQGQGVLLVNGHFNCLEICSRYLAEAMPLTGVYRPLRNQYMERFQTKARLRYAQAMISKRQPKKILTALKQGQIIWFAPDQDFGPKRSIFVPFFNIPAATLTATWRLARSTNSVVLTAIPRRLDNGQYQITIEAALPGVDAAEPEPLLTALNQRIEAAVRSQPADYWWFHRRFKTRVKGAKNLYLDR